MLLSMERNSGPLCVVGPSGYPEEEQLDAARSAGDPIAIPSDASSPVFFQTSHPIPTQWDIGIHNSLKRVSKWLLFAF
ncbi:hypothetical protein PGT21_011911 [Puccinia graminis f. sp. tritici]|uniref:Uncharacterized protein n=1 Tax=Puccinia graminis f. sp. tritici TaxID=56615 RepID=A0A5B0PRQ2_PUCGR|nr:hypothetical protein PGT21_011911 [Puccinia graminis f. sp. tritici]